MRRLVGLACLGLVARAAASPSASSNQNTTIAALERYLDARIADRLGDSLYAASKYSDAVGLADGCDLRYRNRICDPANAASPALRATIYLAAAMHDLALDNVTEATGELDRALAIAPASADRTTIERLRAKIGVPERAVTIGGRVVRGPRREVDGIVLVDGVLAGPSPVTLAMKPGKHVAERVTASTYAVRLFESYKTWNPSYVPVDSTSETTGNVVIAGNLSTGGCSLFVGTSCRSTWTWSEGTHQLAVGIRFALPKGHYKTTADSTTCKPFEFDVASTSRLTYVNVDGSRTNEHACFDVEHVATQSLVVPSP